MRRLRWSALFFAPAFLSLIMVVPRRIVAEEIGVVIGRPTSPTAYAQAGRMSRQPSGRTFSARSEPAAPVHRSRPSEPAAAKPGTLRDLPARLSYGMLQSIIDDAARAHGLHPALLRAVIRVGSGYRTYARSPDGAVGLMAVPASVTREADLDDPFEPRENIQLGARHLKALIDEFDSVRLALAAYSETPELVRNEGVRPKPETRRFVEHVLRGYANLRILYMDPKP